MSDDILRLDGETYTVAPVPEDPAANTEASFKCCWAVFMSFLVNTLTCNHEGMSCDTCRRCCKKNAEDFNQDHHWMSRSVACIPVSCAFRGFEICLNSVSLCDILDSLKKSLIRSNLARCLCVCTSIIVLILLFGFRVHGDPNDDSGEALIDSINKTIVAVVCVSVLLGICLSMLCYLVLSGTAVMGYHYELEAVKTTGPILGRHDEDALSNGDGKAEDELSS